MTSIARISLAISLLTLGACVSGGPDEVGRTSSAATATAPDTYPFSMGATNITVGIVSIWNDANGMTVTYTMAPGYTLAEAHVCVSLAPFAWVSPGNCGNNVPGVFGFYQTNLAPGTTTVTFTIAWSDLGLTGPPCGSIVYLQVHGAILDANGAPVGTAYAGTFKGHIVYTVTCDDPPPQSLGCTLTQGFWKTHPKAWPVSSLTIGGVTYTQKQLITILGTAPKGDCSLIMGDQLISAMLNVASGASTPPNVAQGLADAQVWMSVNKDADGTLPYGIRPTPEGFPNPAVWDTAISLGSLLDQFNNGFNGPPHCP